MDNKGIEEKNRCFIYAPLEIKKQMVLKGFKDIDCFQDDSDKRSSLLIAARYGDYDTVNFLIEKGANVNNKDNFGNTALHLCVFENSGCPYPTTNPNIFFLLIANGANPFEKYCDETPLEWAKKYNIKNNLDGVIQFYNNCKSKDSIFTYMVAALKERVEYHFLDASTLKDLYEMM